MKKSSQYSFGDRLREVRERKSITLKALAQEVGLSESLISQIERNRVSPSIDTLLSIISVLDIDMEYLFKDFRKKRNVDVVRREDRKRIISGNVIYEQLSVLHDGGDEHAIEAFHLEIAPGAEKGTMEYGHVGREMGFILTGEAELRYGSETYRIGKGDSITFSSERPHILKNTGNEKLSAIWIITPPKMLFRTE